MNLSTTYLDRFLKLIYFISILLISLTLIGCDDKKKEGTMYEEFDGVLVIYQPMDTELYRELLPDLFGMPDTPLVQVFVINYYKMAPWAIKPYLEAAVFLLATYDGREAWHCITMPVTTQSARLGGIIYLGYPKVMGNITFERGDMNYSGTLRAGDNTVMDISLITERHYATTNEKKWFQRLAGIPSLNILRGDVVNPLPGSENQKQSILDLAEQYPDLLEVRVGEASLSLYPEAAKGYKDWKDKAFRIEPEKIVLSYYFKSKYGFSFGEVKKVGDSTPIAIQRGFELSMRRKILQ